MQNITDTGQTSGHFLSQLHYRVSGPVREQASRRTVSPRPLPVSQKVKFVFAPSRSTGPWGWTWAPGGDSGPPEARSEPPKARIPVQTLTVSGRMSQWRYRASGCVRERASPRDRQNAVVACLAKFEVRVCTVPVHRHVGLGLGTGSSIWHAASRSEPPKAGIPVQTAYDLQPGRCRGASSHGGTSARAGAQGSERAP